jgi:2-polyprenyl-6-methoxyphenol hydroxylase-like FAD-dependent oxidoreductase
MLPQSETEAILGELLRERGLHIEWDMECVGFEQKGGRVVARLHRPGGAEEEAGCGWLVTCEGAHSPIRKQSGIDFAAKTYPLGFFMADVAVNWALPHGEHHIWFHPDGSFAALSMPGPRRWRLFVELTRQADRLTGEVTLDVIRELMHERAGHVEATVSDPTWVSEFRVHARMVDRLRSGRVLLAGDAAHIHSPTGGQGIVTGIQDATNLAWKLARVVGGAPDALLDTYQDERLPKAREVLAETDRTTTFFVGPTRVTRLAQDYLILPVLRLGWVQRRLFARLSQLHVHYRASGLSSHQDSRPWPFGASVRPARERLQQDDAPGASIPGAHTPLSRGCSRRASMSRRSSPPCQRELPSQLVRALVVSPWGRKRLAPMLFSCPGRNPEKFSRSAS